MYVYFINSFVTELKLHFEIYINLRMTWLLCKFVFAPEQSSGLVKSEVKFSLLFVVSVYINKRIYYKLGIFQVVDLLLVVQLLQSSGGRFDCTSISGLVGPDTSYCFLTVTTMSDPTASLFLLVLQKKEKYVCYTAYFQLTSPCSGRDTENYIFTGNSELLVWVFHVTVS
jgi:hypothetical protein